MTRKATRAAWVLPLLLASCTVGPNYQKPQIAAPPTHRNDLDAEASKQAAVTLAEVKWFDLFQDEELQKLIRTALEKNYSVLIAAERILQARAQLRISRADLYPTVDGQVGIGDGRVPGGVQQYPGSLQMTMSWELDLWGRIRRSNEAARANILASEDAQRGVYQSLVAELANAYFTLRELDLELEISNENLDAAQQQLDLVTLRYDEGIAALSDVYQSEQLARTIQTQIP